MKRLTFFRARYFISSNEIQKFQEVQFVCFKYTNLCLKWTQFNSNAFDRHAKFSYSV